ncbi:cytochrome C551 [Chryseobacterium lathyri]|uniref:Carbohydrate-binding DOMON domain-containing protein n=1 Tax=Chryseobacterium lathyri TaxID=395933 RepID=A0ABT9SP07_9FLAO|nr:cytochrome C551 [Chryseobacterium lathyri]MDP9960536.1 carbohydrate-binding DOMON domain-containing protein [Chryseobacterium lathyri]
MRKFLIAAIGLGIAAVSCGTKESSMSSGNTDSTAVDTTRTVTPRTTDTTATKTVTPADTMKMKVDSMATTPPTK